VEELTEKEKTIAEDILKVFLQFLVRYLKCFSNFLEDVTHLLGPKA